MVDLSLVYLVPTFLVPQIVGGLLLGFGFVIGGYCPGTSCVAAVTGRIDGMVYVAGMIAGLLGFAEFYPYIQNLVTITPMGQITLPRLFNLPYGLLVFAVVLMALGAFMAGEWAEIKFGGKKPDPKGSLIGRPWRFTPVRVLAMSLLAAAGFVAAFGAILTAAAMRPLTPKIWRSASAKARIRSRPRDSRTGSSKDETISNLLTCAVKRTLPPTIFLRRKCAARLVDARFCRS